MRPEFGRTWHCQGRRSLLPAVTNAKTEHHLPTARSHPHTSIALELKTDRRVRISAEIATIRPYDVADGWGVRLGNAAAREGPRGAL